MESTPWMTRGHWLEWNESGKGNMIRIIRLFISLLLLLLFLVYKNLKVLSILNQFVSYQPLYTHLFSVHGMMSRKVTPPNVAFPPMSIALVSFHPLATLSFAVLIFRLANGTLETMPMWHHSCHLIHPWFYGNGWAMSHVMGATLSIS